MSSPADRAAPAGPLDGKIVIDLTVALAGPYATLLMAGLGARVIKIEQPGSGDMARDNAPYLTADGVRLRRESQDDLSVSMLIRGRGKESVTLDLKSAAGREVLMDLVREADIVVENFSAGVTQRLGIDYTELRALNPRLVYTSISGFGRESDPGRKAMDTIIQGLSGLMFTTGERDGSPIRLGIPIADLVAPLFGVIGTLAALRHAEQHGVGQLVDVSMLGSLTSLVAAEGFGAMEAVGMDTRPGATMPRLAPFGTFEARDGWLTVCAPTDQLARGVFAALGRPELASDESFATRDARVANANRVHAILAGWVAECPRDEALARLRSHGVPAEPVRSPADAVRDENVLAREEVVALSHPIFGPVADLVGPGLPIVFSRGAPGLRRDAPMLGAHTDVVLHDVLGYAPDRIKKLRSEGVIS